jgi:hypothetical protein
MKTTCAHLILLLGTLCPLALHAQVPSSPSASQMRELRTSFDTLFQAMKDGNVAVIQQYFAGQMSAEYKVLLEQNQDYPAFLRNFYKGATFSISNVTPTSDGDMIVDVVIQFASGSRSVTRLNAKRLDGAPAKWKVTGVANDPGTSTRNK